jgi:hypothetical protein
MKNLNPNLLTPYRKELTMKKSITLLTFAIFAAAVFAYAAGESKPELRPTQVVMQARAAWMKAMSDNLGTNKFEAIVKDADDLSAQTKKIGEDRKSVV